MTDYVLVHGGWCGSWVYDQLAAALRTAGHRVLVTALTGLGTRQKELNPAITLATHVGDVLTQIEEAGINRFNLVGHSYGGMVITGVASELGARIDALIYIDAFVPDDGQSVWDITENWGQSMFINLQRDTPGLVCPPPALANMPLTPHPLLTILQPVRLTGEESKVRDRVYICATGYPSTPFARFSEKLKNDPAWQYHEADCGHFIMTERPEQTLEILLRHT